MYHLLSCLYNPHTGKELWKIRYRGFSNAPRPLVQDGVAYICTGSGRSELWAVRMDGREDVTDTHVLWRYARNVPRKPSPLLVGDLIYMVDDSGVATCLDARTGEEVWKERMGGAYSASPVYADGRIYFFSEEGKTTVLRPGRKYEVFSENRLNDGFMASPAIAGKAFFLRTKTHLYRIAQ